MRTRTNDMKGRLKQMPANPRRWLWIGTLAAVMATALVAAAAAGPAKFVRVKVNIANIREGPGTRYPLLWRVEQNFPLKVVERRKSWLKTIDFLGDEGWIYAPLTDGKPAVVVEVDLANIRSGPGKNHPIRFKVEWGTGFRVTDRRGQWLKVRQAGGNKGWIHGNLVWGGRK